MKSEAELMPVAAIVVGKRVRKELAHQGYLSESIRLLGLLHPIVVNSRNELVAGFRRLQAVKSLGWESVPVRRIDSLDDALSALRAEQAENTCREPFTMTEMVEIGRMIEELEKPKAAERKGGRPRKETSGKLPAVSGGDTRDKVAKALGVSGKTYEKAKKVVEAAESEPEKFEDIAQRMEESGKVDPAYRELKSRKEAPTATPQKQPAAKPIPSGSTRGRKKGEELARQAIAILNSIHKHDLLRDRALQLVREWLDVQSGGVAGADVLPSFYSEMSRLTELVGKIPEAKKRPALEGQAATREQTEPWDLIKPWDVVESLEETARALLGKARSLRRVFGL